MLFIKLYSCFPRQYSIKQKMWMVENTDIKMCYTSILPSPWQQQQPLLSSYEVTTHKGKRGKKSSNYVEAKVKGAG